MAAPYTTNQNSAATTPVDAGHHAHSAGANGTRTSLWSGCKALDYPTLRRVVTSPTLSNEQKVKLISQLGHAALNELYATIVNANGLPRYEALEGIQQQQEQLQTATAQTATAQTLPDEDVQQQVNTPVRAGYDATQYITPQTTSRQQPPAAQASPPQTLQPRTVQPTYTTLEAAQPTRRPYTAPNTTPYAPAPEYLEPAPTPTTTPPIYPPYQGHFTTSAAAKAHRKRPRVPAKALAPDINRVRQHGRAYWVRRIYSAMIDISAVTDGSSSIHAKRFTEACTSGSGTGSGSGSGAGTGTGTGTGTSTVFAPQDLEATAHHIFDAALAVHTRGWTRPLIYHKKVVRGKLTDVSAASVEARLARICACLAQRKAVVDDAIRGGVTLALLCDNPDARGFTKMSNNEGNKRRGEKLRAVRERERALKEGGMRSASVGGGGEDGAAALGEDGAVTLGEK